LKTREALYKETTEIMRVMAAYKTLKYHQILRLYPDKPEIVRNIISKLIQQKRIVYSDDNDILSYGDDNKQNYNRGLISAFWVLIDFIDEAEYHSPSEYPAQIAFFMNNEFYEIIYAEPEKEILINHILSANKKEQSHKIIVVENEKQIHKITAEDIVCFCIIDENGNIEYYNLE